MKTAEGNATDRHYRAYRCLVALSLGFALSLGAYFLIAILGYFDEQAEIWSLALGAIYLAAVLGVKIHASGAAVWGRRDPLFRTIFGDEWSSATRNRASRFALVVTLLAQLPLAVFMGEVPPDPSPIGMGALTMSLGVASFFAAYLYHGRQPSDG